jgi:hypothetical protein
LYKAPLSTSNGSDEGARSENDGGGSSNISSDLPWVVTAVVPCGSKASGNPTGFVALGCPTTAWDYGAVDAEGRSVVFAAGESSLLSDGAAATSTAADAGLAVWPPAYGADRSPDKGAVIAYFPRAKLAVVAVHLHTTSKAGHLRRGKNIKIEQGKLSEQEGARIRKCCAPLICLKKMERKNHTFLWNVSLPCRKVRLVQLEEVHRALDLLVRDTGILTLQTTQQGETPPI